MIEGAIAGQARALFGQRAALAGQLAAIDRELDTLRRRASDALGYRVPIRVEAFRREVGA